jgi:hypothetical protein
MKMSDSRRTAAIVGILFIVGTCAGVSSAACTGPILGSPNYLAAVSANQMPMQLGVLFVLIMGFSLAMVPILMFPIFRRQDEALAVGYVVFRGALETATYIAFAISWLGLVSVGRDFAVTDPVAASQLQSLGGALRRTADSSQLMTVFVFGFGALIFYWLLFKARLVPRWLPIWGFASIVLHLTTGFLQLFGLVSASSPLLTIMNLPIFLQEMVMAVWLIARGFNTHRGRGTAGIDLNQE